MGNTPINGWTTADADTEVEDYPAVMTAGILDIENSLYIDGANLTPTTPYSAYPVGSSLTLIPVGSEGWPAASGLLSTFRQSSVGSFTWQMFVFGAISDHPQIYARIGGSPGWSAWSPMAGAGQPAATASGAWTIPNVGAPVSVTVAFPAGRFSTTPVVVVSTHDRSVVAATTGGSKDGFTLLLGANGGGDTIPFAGYTVNWIAIQNY